MANADMLTDVSAEVDLLTDDDVEVTMMSEHILSAKRMRIKLLDFLIHSPPPEPLHWVSFRDYIIGRFKSYYSEKIIKDVFHLIDRTITKTRRVSAVIDLDGEDDSSVPICEKGASSQGESQLVTDPLNRNKSCGEPEEVAEVLFFNTPLDSSCSREEVESFKSDPTVHTYSKLFKDIYKLLKDIQESTSCRICSKLRYRLTRFQQAVSSESQLLKKAAQSEQVKNQRSPRERWRSTDSKMGLLYQKLTKEFLTPREAEKIREAILTDKLLELSYPDVLSSAELHRPSSDDVAGHPGARSPSSTQSKRKKKGRHSRPDSDITGAADMENYSNPEPAPTDTKASKRKSRKKTPNSATVTPDSTEAADMEDDTNSKTALSEDKSSAKRWKKRRNPATITPISSENALGVDGAAPDELVETSAATAKNVDCQQVY